ncbi:receptor-like protein Cf-9 [Pistacia vera]|uniref:receptor-like protein Cf-9 n=1 Tax=Pistacia vera TaxID=55513 RepID=UPI001263AAC5|nr:receptor-like protein Cf-9 [Pistacia vera]
MGFLLRVYHVLYIQLLYLCSQSSASLCSPDQSSALLQFQQLFSFVNRSFFDCDYYDDNSAVLQLDTPPYCDGRFPSYPKTMSWKEDKDCCPWDGVTCDSLTGHVIGLDLSCGWLQGNISSNSSSLFLLNHLQKLNLAYNDFNLSQIPSDFNRFSSLTHLNLSNSYFSGQIPSEITHLSKLVVLDLSENSLETTTVKGLVQILTDLIELLLDYVSMSTVVPSSFMNLSTSLSSLSLSHCELQGNFPDNIFHLPNLKILNLARNSNLTGILPKVNCSSPLKFLDVSEMTLSRELPNSIGIDRLPWKNLVYLDLHSNLIQGPLPNPPPSLTLFSLSNNNFTGEIPLSFYNMSGIEILNLSYNNLSGTIPKCMANFSSLHVLDLRKTRLYGSIPGIFA